VRENNLFCLGKQLVLPWKYTHFAKDGCSFFNGNTFILQIVVNFLKKQGDSFGYLGEKT